MYIPLGEYMHKHGVTHVGQLILKEGDSVDVKQVKGTSNSTRLHSTKSNEMLSICHNLIKISSFFHEAQIIV